MSEQERNIQKEAQITMLLHNHEICDKLNNITLGVLIGVFSGLVIEIFMDQDYKWQNIVFIGLCIVATILLIIAIHLNNKFIEKCNEKIRQQVSYKTQKEIKRLVNIDNPSTKKRFNALVIFSFLCIIVGVCLFVFVDKNIDTRTSNPTPPIEHLSDSIKHLNGKIEQQNEIIKNYCIPHVSDTINNPQVP